MRTIRWGMIGCGDVAEVKSGPGLQKAEGSALVAVMRRDRAKVEDFARRHGVPRVYTDAAELIADPEVDVVYIATPPSTHCELSLMVAAAGKPCLVEKPMAIDHGECLRMIEAFANAGQSLWVAYYRRALPRFVKVRELLNDGVIGVVTSVHVEQRDRLTTGDRVEAWRFDPAVAGGGLFVDMGSHCLDLLDFFLGPVAAVHGFAGNTGHAYSAEDVTVAAFQFPNSVLGTGVWNFNASDTSDKMVFTGTDGELTTPIFTDGDVIMVRGEMRTAFPIRNPPHVHQPLIQTIVDEMLGRGCCESTGESGARTAWVTERCLVKG
jgi:predicted dehydrogenase